MNNDDGKEEKPTMINDDGKEEKFLKAEVKIRCSFGIIKKIKRQLTFDMYSIFKSTCFGHWLDVQCIHSDSLLVHLILQHQIDSLNPKKDGLFYYVAGESLRFGPKEFSLITGCRFGKSNWKPVSAPDSFRSRVLNEFDGKIQVKQLEEIFLGDITKWGDADAARIALLLLVEMGFKGTQLTSYVDDFLISLVEDLNAWNEYPWGDYLWDYTFSNLHNVFSKKLKTMKDEGKKSMNYSLPGFIWVFKMWIYEVFPEFKLTKGLFMKQTVPRYLSWGIGNKIMWVRAVKYIENATKPMYRPTNISPNSLEMNEEWWIATCCYLDDVPVPDKKADFEYVHVPEDPSIVFPTSDFGNHFSDFKKPELENMINSTKKERQQSPPQYYKEMLDQLLQSQKTIYLMIDQLQANQNATHKCLLEFIDESRSFFKRLKVPTSEVEVENAQADAYVNCDVVSTPSDDVILKVDKKSSPVALARPKRTSKPSAALCSPYTILKKAPRASNKIMVDKESGDDIEEFVKKGGETKLALIEEETVNNREHGAVGDMRETRSSSS